MVNIFILLNRLNSTRGLIGKWTQRKYTNVLQLGPVWPAGDASPNLETFLVNTTGEESPGAPPTHLNTARDSSANRAQNVSSAKAEKPSYKQ